MKPISMILGKQHHEQKEMKKLVIQINFIVSIICHYSCVKTTIRAQRTRSISKPIIWRPIGTLSNPDKKKCFKDGRYLYAIDNLDRKIILNTHNHARATVVPPASDMIEMTYSYEAEILAENWAKRCITRHDTEKERTPKAYSSFGCGQNVAYTSSLGSWADVIRAWESEKYDFKYGGPQPVKYNRKMNVWQEPTIGHYLQMVWSASKVVGCAVSYCPRGNGNLHYFWVCNYCPKRGVSTEEINYPYMANTEKQACKKCLNNGVCQTRGRYAGRLYKRCDTLCQNKDNYCETYYKRYILKKQRTNKLQYLRENCPRHFNPQCRYSDWDSNDNVTINAI